MTDNCLSYKDWLEDPFNEGRNYREYMDEEVLFDEVEFFDEWISKTEIGYLNARKDNLDTLAACLVNLLPILKNARQTAQKKEND